MYKISIIDASYFCKHRNFRNNILMNNRICISFRIRKPNNEPTTKIILNKKYLIIDEDFQIIKDIAPPDINSKTIKKFKGIQPPPLPLITIISFATIIRKIEPEKKHRHNFLKF